MDALALRMARHPSESAEFIARLLAYCLEYQEGIGFSRGLCDPEEPTIAVRDLTGAITVWIDVGTPDAARLHRASKAAGRVAVYTHKDPAQLLAQLAGERIHRAEFLELYSLERALVADFVAHLQRRTAFDLSVTDRHLFVSIDGATLSGEIERHVLGTPG